jgi:hypothetical protein
MSFVLAVLRVPPFSSGGVSSTVARRHRWEGQIKLVTEKVYP